MIKKILTATLGIGMVLGAVVPAFAGINISNTGQQSNLDTRITRVKNHVFNLSNSYTLNQNVVANQTTGDNTADNNTKDGLAAAGNVTGNHTTQVEANTSNVDIDMTENSTCNCSDNFISVNTTGQNSTANAVIDSTRNLTVNLTNAGSVNNTFTSIVNTGGNSANNNTGNGTAVGGDASIWSIVTTKLNSVFYKIRM